MSDIQAPTFDLGEAFSKAWEMLTNEDRIELLGQATKKLGERAIVNALQQDKTEDVSPLTQVS